MKGIFLFFVVLLGLALEASAQSPGVSPYFIFSNAWQKNCSAMLAQYGRLPTVRASVLWNTPGTNTDCYNRMVGMANFSAIEIHLTNGPCQRNRRCGRYEFVFDPRNPAAFSAYASDAYNRLIPQLRPSQTCYISPELEGNRDPATRKQMMDLAYAAFKGRCFAVDNPLKGQHLGIPGTYFEQHGTPNSLGAPCIWNNDGTSISPGGVRQTIWKYDQCVLAAYWTLSDNCNVGLSGFVDPRLRRNCTGAKEAKTIVDAILPAFEAKPAPQGPVGLDYRDLVGCPVQIPSSDGPGNFVFKESDTKLTPKRQKAAVALFPRKYKSPARFRNVFLMRQGQVLDRLFFAYYRTEDRSDRQTWVSHLSPMELPFYAVLHADSVCVILANPKIRND